MEQKAIHFFQKERIKPEDILYILRNDRKSILHLTDGRCLETYIPVKYLLEALPQESFLNITKGVVLSTAGIYQIEGSVYTMIDGRQFAGRKRGAGEHKINRHRLQNRFASDPPPLSQSITEHFSILDHSPLPHCAIQLISNSSGHVTDFIFRYGNQALFAWAGIEKECFIGHSFYDVQKNWNHRWTAICTDVGIHGTTRVITDYHNGHQCPVTVYCYQPMEHYCVFCMVPGSKEDTKGGNASDLERS